MTKRATLPLVILLIILFTLSAVTLAWFVYHYDFNPDVSGSAITGYFYAGDGSAEHPYQIKNENHLYNLAWLQYMGRLNEEKDGKITQLYFELIDDLYMEDVILPPIGTKDSPFVGHFNGNGHCIYDLTVSNYLDDGNSEFGIVTRPLSITEIGGANVSIVGFFGVVGALDEKTAAKLIDDSGEKDISEKVNAVHDVFFDHLTIRTETDRSLIGLLAGYVNGSIENVGIGAGSLVLGENVTSLSAEDVFDMQFAISEYSLIGKYDVNGVDWVDKPTGGSGGSGGSGGATQPGGDTGWGGSLDMYEINRRITYIFGTTAATYSSSTSYLYALNGVLNFTGAMSSKKSPYLNRNNTVYLAEGTYLPLAINQDMLSGTEIAGQNSCVVLPTYQNATSETPRSSNTGYIVGGGKSYSSAYIRVRADVATGYSSSFPGIYKSLATATNSSGTFNGGNFHMLTIDVNGQTYIIEDIYNTNATTYLSKSTSYSKKSCTDFEKYYIESVVDGVKVDTGVRTTLVNTLQGESLVHAMHFMKKINISNPEKITRSVTVNGRDYESYDLLNGAINFSVSAHGYITAVAGTYFKANGAHSLFTIFVVNRDANGNFTQNPLVKITTIKEKRDSSGKLIEYVYNLDPANYESGYTYNTVYDISKMNVLTENGAAYYFEIPLNPGDYAIGCDTGEANDGAYLMYLDIGANGNFSNAEGGGNGGEGEGESAVHKMTGVTFVDDAGITNKSTAGYSVVTFEIAIDENASAHSGLSVGFDRTSLTSMTCAVDDPSSVFTITDVKDDANLNVTKTSAASVYALPPGRYRREENII